MFKKNKISVSVFCGAELGSKQIYQDTADEVGKLIAKNNMRLVYGAGGKGLMGKTAYGTLTLKGKIFGVTTSKIASFEKPIENTYFEIKDNIQSRKRRFIKKSDAFIVLTGGFGTFDELFEVLVYKEINDKYNRIHNLKDTSWDKPLVLIDVDNFFKPFEKLIDSLIKTKFISSKHKKYFKIVKNPKEAIAYIKKHIKK